MSEAVVKNSLLVKFCGKLAGRLAEYYSASYTGKVLSKLALWARQSSISKSYNRFVEKEPVFKHSVSYKIIAAAAKAADRTLNKILKALSPYSTHSVLFRTVKSYVEADCPALIKFAAAALASYAVGFAAVVTWKGKWYMTSAAFTVVLLIISLFMFLLSEKLPTWFKNSGLYRLYKYLID